MRSMKTLLRLLGAVSLTTVAASSVVACGKDKVKNMNTQVQKDFEFLDSTGNSLVKLNMATNSESWTSDKLDKVTATKLLEENGTSVKAKSAEAAIFLVDVLKLKAESGEGKDRLFKRTDATDISLKVKTYSPTITKKSDNSDYVITGGTVTIKFEKDNKQLGDDYSLNILGDLNYGVVLPFLPKPDNITTKDFKSISEFKVGKPKKALNGFDLTSFVKRDSTYMTLKSIIDLIKQGDFKFKVITTNDSGNFVLGDSIKFKLSIGEITFATEYTLTIE